MTPWHSNASNIHCLLRHLFFPLSKRLDSLVVQSSSRLARSLRLLSCTLVEHVRLEVTVGARLHRIEAALLFVVAVAEVVTVAGVDDCNCQYCVLGI